MMIYEIVHRRKCMDTKLNELYSILGSIDSLYRDASIKLGVTETEMNILYVLCYEGSGCNQSCLYKKTGITKSTINSALHKMVENGLVELRSGDKRNVRVFLTAEGEELSERTAGRLIQIEQEIFEGWSPEDIDHFLALNRRYRNDMKEKIEKL